MLKWRYIVLFLVGWERASVAVVVCYLEEAINVSEQRIRCAKFVFYHMDEERSDEA